MTEAGPAFQGTVKSATAFGALLSEGIGDTIRVSLSAPPVEEVKVGIGILESMGMRERGLEIVSCPSCGRAQVDVYKLAEQVTAGLTGLEVPLRVAVMGCVVNGPGEAREADLGVASGNGKGQIFVKGKVIETVPESKIVETLIEEAMKLAEHAGRRAGHRPQPRSPFPDGQRPSRPTRCRLAAMALAASRLAVRGELAALAERAGCQQAVGDEDVHLIDRRERARLTTPHLVWSASTTTRRARTRSPVGLRLREVRRGEAGLRVDAVQPRNSVSKWRDRSPCPRPARPARLRGCGPPR